jgi:metallo-beta-lactamase family protein
LKLDGSGRLRARFLHAGHILGACFIELRVAAGGGEIRIVYGGDLGRFDPPLHLPPQRLPACDVLIIESTYGDRLHRRVPVLEQLRRPLKAALARGGTVLIPAFAVGRSQQITLMLRRLMRTGALPEVPIHLDSPMAVDATRIYSRYLNPRHPDAELFENGRLELLPDGVELHRTVEDSKRLNFLPGPRVILSSSGMLSAGRVLHHLKRLAPDEKNLLVLVGYQGIGTRGRKLLDGARTVRLHGREVPVRAGVASINGLSGHADYAELLRWAESAPQAPRLTFVVHGEPRPAEALAARLRRRLGTRTIVPRLDDEFDLLPLLESVAPHRS